MTKTFRDWMRAKYDDDALAEVMRHGAGVGWPGITTYHETMTLYDKHEEELWDMMYEDSESFGSSSVMEFIAGWNTAAQIVDDATFKNYVVWYAAEKVADELLEGEW